MLVTAIQEPFMDNLLDVKHIISIKYIYIYKLYYVYII